MHSGLVSLRRRGILRGRFLGTLRCRRGRRAGRWRLWSSRCRAGEVHGAEADGARDDVGAAQGFGLEVSAGGFVEIVVGLNEVVGGEEEAAGAAGEGR